MATFVLIPGAGTAGSAYEAVAEGLTAAGHQAVAVDLPCEDPAAGLPEYVDAAAEAVGGRTGLVVVAQSLGAFTGVELCARLPVELLVLVCPMIPNPGESPGEWWANTDHEEAIAGLTESVGPASEWSEETMAEVFLNDCSPETLADAARHLKEQGGGIMGSRLSLEQWPDVPTRVLAGTEDRFFPKEFQQRVTQERLGFEPDEIVAGHVPMLSRPAELTELLLQYLGVS